MQMQPGSGAATLQQATEAAESVTTAATVGEIQTNLYIEGEQKKSQQLCNLII